MPVTISMITPAYNAGKTIEATIQSVARQSPWCTQYVVIDALSKDDTPQIVERHRATIDVYVREKDAGLYDGMNKGIRHATGEVLGIINADDLLAPGALEQVARAFEDRAVDYVFSNVDLIDEQGAKVGMMPARIQSCEAPTDWLGRDWRFLVPFPHPGLFVRRRVYERIGTYDTSFRLAADHEFMARLLSHRLKGVYINASLAQFRVGGASSGSLDIFAEDEVIARRYGMNALIARLNRVRSSLGRMKMRALGASA